MRTPTRRRFVLQDPRPAVLAAGPENEGWVRATVVAWLSLDASGDGPAAHLAREIRIAAQLDHPLILMLIDPNQGHSGAAAGLFYYVMPYASRAKPSALGYAHARGVIHRGWRSATRDLDTRHVTHYHCAMIKTFADKRTQELFAAGATKRFPPDVARRAARKLEYVDLATTLDDLRVPPGNRLHALKGNRKGQHAIAVNDQWRICFRFTDGDAYDVEICDYH